jgi:hypothetical protein
MKYETDKRKPNKKKGKDMKQRCEEVKVLMKSQLCLHWNENSVLESLNIAHV